MGSGSETLDAIRSALITAGIGVASSPGPTDWMIYVGFLEDGPPNHDRAIALYETPGEPPLQTWLITYPSLQVVVRGAQDEYPEARQKQQDIYALLHCGNVALGDNFVYCFAKQSAPISMGRDEKRRPKSAWNYRMMRNTPTSNYVGPLDLAPGAVLAYGQRALSVAKLGTPLYTIQRTVDDATQVFSSDATTGDAPTAAMDAFIGAATFQQTGNVIIGNQDIELFDATGVKTGQLITGANIPDKSLVSALEGGTFILISEAPTASDPAEVLTFTQSGIVSVWNDQSPSGANATSDAARIVIDQQNGRPSIRTWTGFQASGFSVPANGGVFTVVAAAPFGWILEADDNNSGGFVLAQGTSGGPAAACICDSGLNPNEAGGEKLLPQDNTIHLFSYVWQYGAKQFLLDGVDKGFDQNNDSGGPIGDMVLDSVHRLLSSSVGFMDVPEGGFEFIVWPRALSQSELAAVTENMASYYGITLG